MEGGLRGGLKGYLKGGLKGGLKALRRRLEGAGRIQRVKLIVKGSLVGETSVLRTFRMSGKELVKERVSQRKS